jgi:hydrogenase-4 component I
MQAVHHVQGEEEHSQLLFPDVPPELRVEVEREARRMAGYWAGRNIACTFLEFIRNGDSKKAIGDIEEYLKDRDDPRLTEIMRRLEEIFLSREAAK